MARRWPGILLLLVWCALGTGLLAYLHEWQDAREDAVATHHHHDANDCAIHAQLHAPALAGSPIPLAIITAEAVASPLLPVQQILPQAHAYSDPCRGPPIAC